MADLVLHQAIQDLIKARDTFGWGPEVDEKINALRSLSTQPQQAGWISVNDRLPELPVDAEDDGVKVYTWNGDFVDEDVFAPEWEQPAGPAVGGWLRTGEWFCSDTANRVTHWMLRAAPLPPAPGQEGVEA